MKIQFKKLLLLAAISISSAIAFTGCASSHDHDHSGHSHASAKAYPLKTCMVTDEDLTKDAYAFVYKGQEIKLCCEPCKEDFDKNPSKYLKKLAGK